MKSIFGICLFLTICLTGALNFSAGADEYTGRKTLGLQTGFSSYNKSALAGIEFTYRFNRHLRFAPSANYIFRRFSKDALSVNLNVHVPFQITPRWDIYPFAGLNYSSWNYHTSGTANEDSDVTSRITRFGINAGAGVGLNLSQSLTLGLSAGYTFIKVFHGANIYARIAYRF